MTFYFYDLETSGRDPKTQRIMQFAGRRTTLDLKPIGEPDNFLIQLTPDVIPEIEAVLITGITPQKTLADGLTEEEFLRYFETHIAVEDTIFCGFNTLRFDDEFMRYTHYRNLRDPYSWHWKDGCSRWDLLDVVRMTRALRPEGIEWGFASNGRAANTLGTLTELNNLTHENAHDALSDVDATIEVARLIRAKQPKLFDYMLSMRDKRSVDDLIGDEGMPFVYVSGSFEGVHEKLSICVKIDSDTTGAAAVYDLRYDPEVLASASDDELKSRLDNRFKSDAPRYPVKLLRSNKCPAVAPLRVLDENSKTRLDIDMEKVKAHHAWLLKNKDQASRFARVLCDKKRSQSSFYSDPLSVDSQLYDGFFGNEDSKLMLFARTLPVNELMSKKLEFQDHRLNELFWLYKARQFPKLLSVEDKARWTEYLEKKLMSGEPTPVASFLNNLEIEAKKSYFDTNKIYLLEELALYVQNLVR
jgi:exodeoxyribonuclease I